MAPASTPSIDWSYIAYYALGPLLAAATVIVLARLRPRGALLIVSALSLGILLVGVALYDYATAFGLLSYAQPDDAHVQAFQISRLLRPVGFMLGFAAVVFALALAVRARHWAWVTVLSIAGLVLSWSHRAFYGLTFLFWFGGHAGFFSSNANSLVDTFTPVNISQMHAYFTLFSLLLVTSAIPSVIFAFQTAKSAQGDAAVGSDTPH